MPKHQAAPRYPSDVWGRCSRPLPFLTQVVCAQGPGKQELCSINSKESADPVRVSGQPPAPAPPFAVGKITLMKCQRQLTEHPVPKTGHLKREQNHFLQGALYYGVCVCIVGLCVFLIGGKILVTAGNN